jgi:hypothetical protein
MRRLGKIPATSAKGGKGPTAKPSSSSVPGSKVSSTANKGKKGSSVHESKNAVEQRRERHKAEAKAVGDKQPNQISAQKLLELLGQPLPHTNANAATDDTSSTMITTNRASPSGAPSISRSHGNGQYNGDAHQQQPAAAAGGGNRRGNQSSAPPEEYFPFGRPGAGAPLRDSSGGIIGRRNQAGAAVAPSHASGGQTSPRHNQQRPLSPPSPHRYQQQQTYAVSPSSKGGGGGRAFGNDDRSSAGHTRSISAQHLQPESPSQHNRQSVNSNNNNNALDIPRSNNLHGNASGGALIKISQPPGTCVFHFDHC